MHELLERIRNREPLTPADNLYLQSVSPAELDRVLEQLLAEGASPAAQEQAAMALVGRLRSGQDDWNATARVVELYRASPPARGAWLRLLLEEGSEPSIATAAQLLREDPPPTAKHVAQGLSGLFRAEADADVAQQFLDQSWAALAHVAVAAPLLDLANYLARERGRSHPAAENVSGLQALLIEVSRRLSNLSGQPMDQLSEAEAETARATVEEGVPLAVTLCDALALIGGEASSGALEQALAVPHRRVRTEAAWALAKLGDETGVDLLVEQAADPATRLRAVEYLQELDLLDRVDRQWLTDEARAESAAAAWLAEPGQFGVAPTELKLVDRRWLFWPGYDEEQECFLFRFTYRLPMGELSNLVLAGPVEHAFASDLETLSLDDVYAMFAGWHVEHDEIADVVPEQLSAAGRVEAERLVRRIHDAGYDEIQPQLFSQFFGDKVLVARAERDGESGWAVADAVDVCWLPRAARFGPIEAGYVYKGRRLLRAFNALPDADSD